MTDISYHRVTSNTLLPALLPLQENIVVSEFAGFGRAVTGGGAVDDVGDQVEVGRRRRREDDQTRRQF